MPSTIFGRELGLLPGDAAEAADWLVTPTPAAVSAPVPATVAPTLRSERRSNSMPISMLLPEASWMDAGDRTLGAVAEARPSPFGNDAIRLRYDGGHRFMTGRLPPAGSAGSRSPRLAASLGAPSPGARLRCRLSRPLGGRVGRPLASAARPLCVAVGGARGRARGRRGLGAPGRPCSVPGGLTAARDHHLCCPPPRSPSWASRASGGAIRARRGALRRHVGRLPIARSCASPGGAARSPSCPRWY